MKQLLVSIRRGRKNEKAKDYFIHYYNHLLIQLTSTLSIQICFRVEIENDAFAVESLSSIDCAYYSSLALKNSGKSWSKSTSLWKRFDEYNERRQGARLKNVDSLLIIIKSLYARAWHVQVYKIDARTCASWSSCVTRFFVQAVHLTFRIYLAIYIIVVCIHIYNRFIFIYIICIYLYWFLYTQQYFFFVRHTQAMWHCAITLVRAPFQSKESAVLLVRCV